MHLVGTCGFPSAPDSKKAWLPPMCLKARTFLFAGYFWCRQIFIPSHRWVVLHSCMRVRCKCWCLPDVDICWTLHRAPKLWIIWDSPVGSLAKELFCDLQQRKRQPFHSTASPRQGNFWRSAGAGVPYASRRGYSEEHDSKTSALWADWVLYIYAVPNLWGHIGFVAVGIDCL